MKLLIAQTAGFCMGVRRAVELVLDAPKKSRGPIYTYGPLIHNPQVLEMLAEKGITVLDEIPARGHGTVLIRAHGVPPQTKDQLEAAGFEVIDATCPRVIKVQTIIRRHARQGFATIIIGDPDHPEVIGLLGYADQRGVSVSRMEDLQRLPAFDRAIIVAQTTQNKNFFDAARRWAAVFYPHYKVFDTICDSTASRQAEVRRLAAAADALVVVGGRNSGNTQRLAEIASESGKPTLHVETEVEINPARLAGARTVAVTAGASTPNWIIRRICRHLELLPRSGTWRQRLYSLQQTLLRTNTYVAVGAGGLCLACSQLQGLDGSLPMVFLAMLYVQSMHMLNNLTGQKEDRYNDPGRAFFYQRYRLVLGILAVLSGATGLALAYMLGKAPFVVLLVMSALGLSYNLNLIPRGAGRRVRRIRDLPGSKTVLIALAWGVVTSVLPPLGVLGRVSGATAVVFSVATLLVFSRTAFFDILDVQGDRIVGKETLPILLGEGPTMRLLFLSLAVATAVLALSAGAGLIGRFGLVLVVTPVLMGLLMSAHARGRIHPGVGLELQLESQFVLAGVLALGWRMLT